MPWGALAGLAGSLWASSQNQASAEASIAFQREVLKNRNQWAVEDLKKAGLNPILAAGTTQSTAQGAQYSTENPVSSAVSSAVQVQAMKLAERNQRNQDAIALSVVDSNSAKAEELREKAKTYQPSIDEMVARTGIYKPQAESYASSAEFNHANVDYLGKLGEEVGAKIRKLESDIATAEEQRRLYQAEVHNANTQALKNIAERNLRNIEARLESFNIEGRKLQNAGIEIDNQLKRLGVPKAKSEAAYYNKPGTKFMIENVPGFHKYLSK